MLALSRAFGRTRAVSRFGFVAPTVAGLLLLAPIALVILPGCGGGSSGTPTDTAFFRTVGVELIDNFDPRNPVVFDRGNLTVNLVDSSSSNRTASGTLQLLGPSVILPSPTPTPTATPLLPASGAVNLQPVPGSYLLTGTANFIPAPETFTINLRGAISPTIPFTLTGSIGRNGVVVLNAQTKSGSVVIPMIVLQEPFKFTPTVPTATATGAPTAASTPIGGVTATPTATGTGTAFPTGTVAGTPIGNPTATARATATGSPQGTPGSPAGTPPSPIGTPPSGTF